MISRVERIARMSPAEISWRSRAAARIQIERARVAFTPSRWHRRTLAPQLTDPLLANVRAALAAGRWQDAHVGLARHFAARPARFVLAPAAKNAVTSRLGSLFPDARGEAAKRADRLVRGTFDLLGFENLQFGSGARVDWHYDPVHRRRVPLEFWSRIDYLDAACGDHKIIWELNRHQHWAALGRAYWLTGDRTYRARMIEELASWMEANPPLLGINWASMLELAFRSLSWLWALELFTDPDLDDESPWLVDLLLGLDRQLTHIERNLSCYFSPNTHLLGEALALYVSGRTLPELSNSGRREAVGRRVLVAEMSRQVFADGGHCERSTHYQRYTLDFYLLASIVARITRDPIAAVFSAAVDRLASAARLLSDTTGRVPHLGDDDGGALVMMTGRPPDDLRDSLAIAAGLSNRPDLRAGEPAEETIWLLSHPAVARELTVALDSPRSAITMASASLPETGYYVSRSEHGDHLVADGGAHGYLNGGHAHADALSLVFTRGGTPLLIDPGTGCYTVDSAIRDRFRSTALHNTVEIDNRSQSLPSGPFHWRHTAEAVVHRWRTASGLDYFDAAHDGYAPLVHRRRVVAVHGEALVVADLIAGAGRHEAAVHWHLAPHWTAHLQTGSAILEHAADRVSLFVLGGRLETILAGDNGLGWCSPVYGRLEPTTTIRVTASGEAPFWTASMFDLNPLNPILSTGWVPVWSTAGSMAHATALRVNRRLATDYFIFAEPQSVGTQTVWRVAELESDAAMLFLRISRDGAANRVGLVDGSFVRQSGRGGIRLELGRSWPVLHKDDLVTKDSESCAASPVS